MVNENIIKVDDNNVAIVKEAREIHNKAQLEATKIKLQVRIVEIDKLLAVFV